MCKVNGSIIKEARENAGLTQEKLAEAVGMSDAMIGHIERGYSGTNEDNLNKICYILKLDPEVCKVKVSDSALASNSIVKGLKYNGKRYFEPEEMQEFFVGARNGNDELATSECERACNPANQFAVGNKRYATGVLTKALNIPGWQRRTDALFAREIMSETNYDENSYDPIKVFAQDGHLMVADGVHRALGHLLNNRKYILVEILDTSNGVESIIDGFLTQSIGRRAMSQADIWRGAIENNRAKYISFKNVCKKHNIHIAPDRDAEITNPVATIKPTSKVISMNHSLLDFIYTIIDNLGWAGSPVGNPYHSKMVGVFAKVIAQYGTEPFMNREFFEKYGKASIFETQFSQGTISDLTDKLTRAIGYAY